MLGDRGGTRVDLSWTVLGGRSARLRCRPLVVVVPYVLVEHALEVASTPDQQPVQAFLPDRPHPTLGVGVRVRRLDGCLDDLDAVSGEDGIQGAGELTVAVTNQEPRRGDVLRQFHLDRELPCPLDRPRPTQMISDATEPNSPCPKLDEEPDVEGLEPHGLHDEEVGRDDATGLSSKECPPRRGRSSGRWPKPILNSTVRMVVPTLGSPASSVRPGCAGSPSGVLPGQSQDQHDEVWSASGGRPPRRSGWVHLR